MPFEQQKSPASTGLFLDRILDNIRTKCYYYMNLEIHQNRKVLAQASVRD